jgi:hypothetical protein
VPEYGLLIGGGHVVALDPESGDLPRGKVLIREGKIAVVGANFASRARLLGWWRPCGLRDSSVRLLARSLSASVSKEATPL